MHKTLLREANLDVLRKFMDKAFDELKVRDHDMYDELELDLYKEMYGCHFNDWMLDKALSHLYNEDGTEGKHWDLSATTQVAKNNGIEFNCFNEYDWCYAMNMIYSDYCKVIGNDLGTYVKMASAFLMDKDAPEGKALRYYIAMKK